MTLKQDRTQERIHQILSELFLREISDPHLQAVTVTDVEIDRELRYAHVYVNALGEEARRETIMKHLERAKSFLRTQVGQRIRLRHTPELIFQWDETLEQGERINRLISDLDIPPETEE